MSQARQHALAGCAPGHTQVWLERCRASYTALTSERAEAEAAAAKAESARTAAQPDDLIDFVQLKARKGLSQLEIEDAVTEGECVGEGGCSRCCVCLLVCAPCLFAWNLPAIVVLGDRAGPLQMSPHVARSVPCNSQLNCTQARSYFIVCVHVHFAATPPDLARATGHAEAVDAASKRLNRVLQLTGFSDPIYAEAHVTVCCASSKCLCVCSFVCLLQQMGGCRVRPICVRGWAYEDQGGCSPCSEYA